MKLAQILAIMERNSLRSFFSAMRNSKSARLRPKRPLVAAILEAVVAAAVAEAVSTVAKKVICPGNVLVQEDLEVVVVAAVEAAEVVTIVVKEGICLEIALNPAVRVNSKKSRYSLASSLFELQPQQKEGIYMSRNCPETRRAR